jgi:hypothetical protein
LTSIPAALFTSCSLVQNFSSTFSGCTNVSAIPEILFASSTLVTSFSSCFQNVYALTVVPANLFSNQNLVATYSSCFSTAGTAIAYNKLTSAVPQLWTKPNSPLGTQCFYNRTLASNYLSIPSNWK